MSIRLKNVFENYGILIAFPLLKFFIHLITNIATPYGFHRDEFLYIALGEHIGWGFLEVPPSIAVFAKITRILCGDSLLAIRLFPALLGAGRMLLTGLIVKELGGKKFAQALACLTLLLSPAYLHIDTLFQPVTFDTFYWTLFAYLSIRYLNSSEPKWLIGLGIAIGFGMLNKYTVLLFVAGLLIGALLTRQRKIFKSKYLYLSMVLGLLIFLPNLIWQIQHDFPLIRHMQELSRHQLVNIRPIYLFIDQLLMNWVGLLVWLPGLFFIFFAKEMKTYRMLGWVYGTIIVLLFALSGKGYYAVGAYPVLLAAGALYLEKIMATSWKFYLRPVFMIFLIILSLPAIPYGLPIVPVRAMKVYCQKMADDYGLEGPIRWEDGRRHHLPQDWADMLGWEDLSAAVVKAYHDLSPQDQQRCVIYAENYGEAGSIDFLGEKYNLPKVHSFGSSYFLWSPDSISANKDILIYVNDEIEEISQAFGSVQQVGSITNEEAREAGLPILLCREPKVSIDVLWRQEKDSRR